MRKHKRKSPITTIMLVAVIILMAAGSYAFVFFMTRENDDRAGQGEDLEYGVIQPLPATETEPDISQETHDVQETDQNAADSEPPEMTPPYDVSLSEEYDIVVEINSSPADTITVIDIADINPELAELLDEEAKSHRTAAASLVIYDGHLGAFWTYQYGFASISDGRPVNNDTKFRSASLSKLVVGICAMVLVDEGRLDLDLDIGEYLGYSVRNPNFPGTPITARMLLQHTSTIFDSEPFTESLMGRARLSTQDLLSRGSSYWGVPPGTAFQYTNFGFTVMGAVIEHITNMKLNDFAQSVLFGPMDIDASFVTAHLTDTENIAVLYNAEHGVERSVQRQIDHSGYGGIGQDQHLAQGALMISAFDYAKILAMLGNGGIFQGQIIVSPESVSEMHRADAVGWGFMQGLAMRFSDDGSFMPNDNFYWHTGSAYGIFAQYLYAAGTGTDEGIYGLDTSRGVVVITTGARSGRAENGMIDVCTHLSEIAWEGLGFGGVSN